MKLISPDPSGRTCLKTEFPRLDRRDRRLKPESIFFTERFIYSLFKFFIRAYQLMQYTPSFHWFSC